MALTEPRNHYLTEVSPDAPAVEVIELTKRFRKSGRERRFGPRLQTTVLDRVTFTVARGECIAILGQNGSGKSTLVRLLSTLLIGDGGSARVFGFDVFSEPRNVRRLVNRVSVEASFFKKMSANENLSYAARFYGMRAAETKHSIPEILDRVGFPKDRLNDSMEHLSRGMQQKVALARALLTSPVLLLLDEPTTGLDPRSKLEVQDFIAEVRRGIRVPAGGEMAGRGCRELEHGATVVLCTHDMNEAEKLADRVGILDQGRLLVLEPVDDLKKRYGSATLEEAFFAATGKSFEEEDEGGAT